MATKMPARHKTVAAVYPNAGVEASYRRQLKALISEMTASTLYWVPAAYRKDPPRMVEVVDRAEDGPSNSANRKVLALKRRFMRMFSQKSNQMAEDFANKMLLSSDISFQQSLGAAGLSIKFQMTRPMQDALSAVIAENVALIKSIPEQYFNDVQGIVMRGYAAGGDLYAMTNEITRITGITNRRAVLISRDQSNKANAITNKARQLELGITQAIWKHSHAGEVPRPDHLAADGRIYNIAEGCPISGEFIQPGQKINCRCTCKSILPLVG